MSVNTDVDIIDGYFGKYIYNQKEKEFFFKPLGKAVIIDKITEQLETGDTKFKLSFKVGRRTKTIEVDRSMLTTRNITELLSKGIDSFDHSSEALVKTLQNQEEETPISFEHKGIGWYKHLDQLVFRGIKLLGGEEKKITSIYTGQLDITPKGDYKVWYQMVIDLVMGKVELEFSIITGLSATVNSYLGDKLGNESLFVHLYGDSSTGKTTAGELCISVAGNPSLSTDGLMQNWSSTDNFLMGLLRDNKGYPVLLDESSMSKRGEFSSMIYTLSSGKEKGRMNKDLTIKESANWNTTIISTGEHSLQQKSNRNTGLKVRVFEFGNVNWTDSAEQADAIKECVRNNYGFAILILAKYLIRQDREAIYQRYDYYKEKYINALPSVDGFSKRIANKMAVFLLTAELASKALKLDFDIDGILNLLIEQQDESMENRDIATEAYRYILEQVNVHANKFNKEYKHGGNAEDSEFVPKGEIWGVISSNKAKEKEINIIPIAFEKLLSEGGFSEPKIILKKWKERGWLDFEDGRLTRKRKITKSAVRPIPVYVIKVIDEKDAN
ncbi:Uncharcterized protein, DUF927 family [Anaerovirgula multivorans]|uniref:Uncharcterized protein, DUF927 family n=1 Tax=Anaerovirgula multivorans TaxID=312168 RepID=A0A239KMC9_9FIRM|nr:DUF927 domain-containing protein [Anaerovirgula multivorans]SNT19311.1 Uncharcterized protein, DUF927 family [Anaerovirgula multivorans]